MASDTGTGFVACFARFLVPSSFQAVSSHSPKAGVAFGTSVLVTSGAGIVAMAGLAVLSVFIKDSPVGFVAVEFQPETFVIGWLDLFHVLGVASVAVGSFDDDFVFRVTGVASVETNNRCAGFDFVFLDVAVAITTLC